MKKLVLFYLFFASIGINAAFCQCGSMFNTITLSNQTEVNEFLTAAGPTGCNGATAVIGRLRIEGTVTDLSPLSGLTSVQELEIVGTTNLQDLDGLENLTTAGSSILGIALRIFNNSMLEDVSLPALTNLDGGIQISNNAALTSINMPLLGDIVGGGLVITGNNALETFTLPVTSIQSTLEIQNNDNLTSFSLPQFDNSSVISSTSSAIRIENNDKLVSFDLSNLKEMGGSFRIINNPQLTNLNTLSNLVRIGAGGANQGGLTIQNNTNLSLCNGLYRLLDDVDDGDPGPGPGAAGIPDIGGNVAINTGNEVGCQSVQQILDAGPVVVPTMSQWMFWLFGLIIFTLSIVGLYNVRRRSMA